jgi:hypothetical protein
VSATKCEFHEKLVCAFSPTTIGEHALVALMEPLVKGFWREPIRT